ncbi:MAG: alpha/beta hydrolase [Bacteroidales bacterium]|nr:alpha/beta hydrolase [Bacteroidales bacterium]
MRKSIIPLITILLTGLCSYAQIEIKLYNNGAEENNGIIEKEELHGTSWVTNVTEARMYAYFAPKDINTGTAVLICPGGGYGGLAVEHEGSMVASWLNSIGISAFVLYYRMPNFHSEIPLKDAQTAIELIRSNSAKWSIDTIRVGILGFSAGGHLASVVGTCFDKENRPDFMVLIYPVIMMTLGDGTCRNLLGENPTDQQLKKFSTNLQVSKTTPPTFIVAAIDDDVVSIEHSYKFYQALQEQHILSEILAFQSGGHSFGMKKRGLETDNWTEILHSWLKKNKWAAE